MAQSVLAVANTFVEIAREKGRAVTPLQLLKLVYFAHGWNLTLTDGKPLIDETVKAWQFGPVVPSIYRAFKKYKDSPIDRPETVFDLDTFEDKTPIIPKNDSGNVRLLLEKVWDLYGKFTGGQLSNITHAEDSPWYEVWEKRGGKYRKNAEIPDDLIKAYFDKKRKPVTSGA